MLIPHRCCGGCVPTVVLAHDHFLDGHAKTAEALIRYGQDEVVCVVDRASQGEHADAVVADPGKGIPVVPTIEEGLELGGDRLAIGVAPVGGRLPEAWRSDVLAALEQGLDVQAGLHDFLADDPAFAQAAAASGARILDVRRPPADKPIYSGRILDEDVLVVLTVGTDCSSGKMTTAIELVRELEARGTGVGFAATGQTGIMIGADSGVVVDAVPADFVAGWTERIALEAHEATGAEVVVVEGQGALTHPAYAAVSLGLLHGASPQACILCHDAARKHKTADFHGGRRFPVHPPGQEWETIARLAQAIRAPELLGLSIMNGPLPTTDENGPLDGVPRVDVLADGAEVLAERVEALL